VADVRESPALEVIRLLGDKGASVTYHDPYIPEVTVGGAKMVSTALTPQALGHAHCVLLVTDHRCFDYGEIARHASLIVDVRNAFRHVRDHRHKIVTL
jgi:UDP-N-acetyl-D-glucosamine dehydrogenase